MTRRSTEHGSALIVALSIGVPLLILTGSVLATLVQHDAEVSQRVGLATAASISTSGAHHALSILAEDPNFVGTYDTAISGGLARITISDWAGDDLDNDSVNGIDDPGEVGLYGVRSEGWLNPPFLATGIAADRVQSYQQVTELILRRTVTDLTIEQAVYIDDPLADFSVTGNAFLITGYNYAMDGTLDASAPPVPGIGVPGDPSYIASQVKSNQEDNIVGSGGTPSVVTVAPVDLDTLVDSLVAQASLVWTSNTSFSGALGTVAQPVVVHATQDVHLHGNVTGSGILIVDGDLDIVGAFSYDGLIIARQEVRISGGGGSKDLRGGLLCLGAVAADDLTINGTVQIQYSSDVIEMLSSQVVRGSDYMVLSWMEH